MRSQDEFVSKLPVYQARRSEDYPNFLIVTCGRKDCPGTIAGRPFLVSAVEWLRPRRVKSAKDPKVYIITGRTCPYCSRSGRLPRRSEIG